MSTLPQTIEVYARRWSLSEIELFSPENSRGDTAFMARVHSADHGACILKCSPSHPRFPAEIQALQHFNGHGAAKVFEEAASDGAYLMQAVAPGRQLSELFFEGRDEEATHVIAGLIATIRSIPATGRPSAIPPVEDLMVHFDNFLQADDPRATDDIRSLVSEGKAAFEAMLAAHHESVVLHGDLHHFNVLEDAEHGWLAIDPHGYWGPPVFEVGAMMKNPVPDIFLIDGMATVLERRIQLLSEQLGWSESDITRAGFVYAVISLLWTVEEGHWPADYLPLVACLRFLSP